jgi:hypothetical protein
MTLMGETQEEDRKLIADLLCNKMSLALAWVSPISYFIFQHIPEIVEFVSHEASLDPVILSHRQKHICSKLCFILYCLCWKSVIDDS